MTGVRRSVAEIQFSETLWWILVVMSFHSPGMTCCWNGDSAYTTAFMRTGTFPILLLASPLLLPPRGGCSGSDHLTTMVVVASGSFVPRPRVRYIEEVRLDPSPFP
jgi:hypothetical protein